MIFTNETKNSLPQQVQQNADNIKELAKYIKDAYNTQSDVDEKTLTISRAETNVPQNITSGWLLASNGMLFEIVNTIDDVVYLKFWATLGKEGPQGIIGPRGPIGPQGPRGETGPRGLQGERGPAGPQGVQGATGATGIQGPKGEQGNRGPAGPAGPQGIAGATGLQGPQGLQGERGPEGPQGVRGPQGLQGPAGKNGTDFTVIGTFDSLDELQLAVPDPQPGQAYFVGAILPRDVYVYDGIKKSWENQGPLQGPAGEQGPEGPQGLAGPIGPAGPTGPQGPQGLQGLQGETGETGPQGDAGPEGPQGPAGPTGPQGPRGEQGIEGPTGPQGPAGDTGPQGPQGVGIKDIKIDPNQQTEAGIYYHVNVTMTDGSEIFAGDILCPEGPTGPTGPQGERGPAGTSSGGLKVTELHGYDEVYGYLKTLREQSRLGNLIKMVNKPSELVSDFIAWFSSSKGVAFKISSTGIESTTPKGLWPDDNDFTLTQAIDFSGVYIILKGYFDLNGGHATYSMGFHNNGSVIFWATYIYKDGNSIIIANNGEGNDIKNYFKADNETLGTWLAYELID